MKKILCTVLALAMILCSAAFAEMDLVGEWYGSLYGMVITLQANEDGTVSMLMGEESLMDGTWVAEGDQFIINKGQEDETALTINEDAGTLVIDDGETVAIFSREPIEAIVLPEKVAAPDITAFDGTWDLSLLSVYGMTIDAAEAQGELGSLFGDDATSFLTIEGGVANVFGTSEQTFDFVDGYLYIASPNPENDELSQKIDLCEDGSLCYTLMGMEFYFAGVEAN